MHTHTIDLLKRLLGASESGRISWAEVPGKTAYSYLAGEYVVLIDSDSEGTAFRLSDAKGRALEEAGIDDLAAVNLSDGASALSAVQRMHEIAKRQTMGTDEAIAAVITHLQDLEGDEAQSQTTPPENDAIETPPADNDHPQSENVQMMHEAEALPEAEVSFEEDEALMLQSEVPQDDLAVEIPLEPAHTDEVVTEAPKAKARKKRSLFNPFGRKKS